MNAGRRALRRGVVARLGLAASLVCAAFAASPRVEAYVRYKTTSGLGFFWPQTCVPVSVYPASMMDLSGNMDMTPDQIVHAATASAAAWSSATMGSGEPTCTFLKINVTESSDPTPKAGLDYANILVFRTNSWCGPPDPSTGGCSYASEALAITSVFVDKSNGHIVDGDIEVNAKNFVWTDLDADPTGKGKQDLQNALTHEMGHLIGLDHTCFSPGAPDPLDNNGKPVPSCENAPAAVQATTMFASAIPGDTAKRTLAPDDIQAVCDIYPVAMDPMKCPLKDEPPPKTGCALAPAAPGGGAAVLTALAALALAARRRGRARRT
ncbi:MAG TPA: hypothetical protein VMT47_00890 [Polyangia bacterium]|nr:hypothetical protein [Polyangia bacterium]